MVSHHSNTLLGNSPDSAMSILGLCLVTQVNSVYFSTKIMNLAVRIVSNIGSTAHLISLHICHFFRSGNISRFIEKSDVWEIFTVKFSRMNGKV